MEKFACMYLRLSREDGDSTESNSISNQRQIIKSYARDNDFKVVAEYVDDGFSGSNFDRPKFKKMIQDLEEKKFKTIIVKDLSRFGRDYIESGKYLQKIFPEKENIISEICLLSIALNLNKLATKIENKNLEIIKYKAA